MPPRDPAESPAPAESEEREREIVVALRRIIRAVDLHSRQLMDEHGLTGPQLAALRELARGGPTAPAGLAERLHLSRATVSGILSRLEARLLASRRPTPSDGRSVLISLTPEGAALAQRAPSLLQERFRRELARLEEWEQLALLSALRRIATMMDASGLDASPHLVSGALALDPPTPSDPEPGN
jgi:DNA-binding MarR family transcriptional regulator